MVANARETVSCRARSSSTVMHSPPCAWMASPSAAALRAARVVSTTKKPCLANFWARAPPMPQRIPTGSPLSSSTLPCASLVLRPSACHLEVAPTTTATCLRVGLMRLPSLLVRVLSLAGCGLPCTALKATSREGTHAVTESLFADLRVIDCASWIAGPAAATILSDFGANVLKIEPPGAGDPWRALTPIPGKPTDAYWQLTSRNKRSLALDLKHADGRALLYQLLASADVFITNFPLPVRERLQIAPTQVLSLNPRLIYASFTAYGEAGDDAAKTGFDSTAYWARTGLMDAVKADVDTPPARSAPGMGDHPSATGLYAAIVTALYRREKTGRGGVVCSSLLQNGLWANGCFVQTRLFGEPVPHRPPREAAPNALANHYRCRDGRWFIMALFNEDRQLRPLLNAIGREDLIDDPRFATKAARKE